MRIHCPRRLRLATLHVGEGYLQHAMTGKQISM